MDPKQLVDMNSKQNFVVKIVHKIQRWKVGKENIDNNLGKHQFCRDPTLLVSVAHALRHVGFGFCTWVYFMQT